MFDDHFEKKDIVNVWSQHMKQDKRKHSHFVFQTLPHKFTVVMLCRENIDFLSLIKN